MAKLFFLSPRDVTLLRELLAKVGGIRGAGVRNTPQALAISTMEIRPGRDDAQAPAAPRALRPVLVKANGGSGGNKTTSATLTYDLYDEADTSYVTKLNTSGPVGPKCSRARLLKTTVTAAPDGSVGAGYIDKDGAWQLWDCQETWSQNNC
jgi:hypothetical protein